MLYQQCLSVNKYLRASNFLYMCLNHMLRLGRTTDILQLLVNCDLLLNMWRNDIEAESEAVRQDSNAALNTISFLTGAIKHQASIPFSSVLPVSGGAKSGNGAANPSPKPAVAKLTPSQMKTLAPTTNLFKEISAKESTKTAAKNLEQSANSKRRDSFTIFDEQVG